MTRFPFFDIYNFEEPSRSTGSLSVCLSVCMYVCMYPDVGCGGLEFVVVCLVSLFDAKFASIVLFSYPVSWLVARSTVLLVKRVLARYIIRIKDCPAYFVEGNKLFKCSDCKQWFTQLGQHSSKCPAFHLSSSGRTTEVGTCHAPALVSYLGHHVSLSDS